MFAGEKELKKLAKSRLWIMDGTFKTVPGLLRQLYTIHCEIGGEANSRIVPVFYALMTSKSKECYKRIFEEIKDWADDKHVLINHKYILTDFEQAVIRAIEEEFLLFKHKGCLFHLGQSVWRKIQSEGGSNLYAENGEVSLLLRQLIALSFLREEEIAEVFRDMKRDFYSKFDGKFKVVYD